MTQFFAINFKISYQSKVLNFSHKMSRKISLRKNQLGHIGNGSCGDLEDWWSLRQNRPDDSQYAVFQVSFDAEWRNESEIPADANKRRKNGNFFSKEREMFNVV